MQVELFKFDQAEVRTILLENKPWFVAKDVCQILGLDNNRQALTRLPVDEKGVINSDTCYSNVSSMSEDADEKGTHSVRTSSKNQHRKLQIVNEAGLYRLIFTSTKVEAEAFKRWVFHDVLPSIRKTGEYNHTKFLALQKETERLRDVITKNEDDMVWVSEIREAQKTEIPSLKARVSILEQEIEARKSKRRDKAYESVERRFAENAAHLINENIDKAIAFIEELVPHVPKQLRERTPFVLRSIRHF